MMRIVAHRGHSARYKENSVAAWRGAVKAGTDLVEIDVRFTADGHAVCSHDPDLSRLASDPRLISELELGDLAELRDAHPGLVPDLGDAFVEIAAGTGLLFDVKDELPRALDLLAAVLEQAARPNCVLGLHSLQAVRRMAGVAPILALSPRGSDSDASVAAGADIIRLWEADVPSSGAPIDAVPVWVTAGGEETGRAVGDIDASDLRRLAERCVAGVLVNDPEAARVALTPLPSGLT
jgi:glycerophosphoryl diester phosphodiesterase